MSQLAVKSGRGWDGRLGRFFPSKIIGLQREREREREIPTRYKKKKKNLRAHKCFSLFPENGWDGWDNAASRRHDGEIPSQLASRKGS